MGLEGIISGLDMRSSAVGVVGSLGRCTMAKPSSSLDESVTKPMSVVEGLGLCTSVAWPDMEELGCIGGSLAVSVSLVEMWLIHDSALGIW